MAMSEQQPHTAAATLTKQEQSVLSVCDPGLGNGDLMEFSAATQLPAHAVGMMADATASTAEEAPAGAVSGGLTDATDGKAATEGIESFSAPYVAATAAVAAAATSNGGAVPTVAADTTGEAADDDFGDFDAAPPAVAVPSDAPTADQSPGSAAAAAATPQPIAAAAPAVDDGDDDDFGDFDAAPPAPPVPAAAPVASFASPPPIAAAGTDAADAADEFGDFGDATAPAQQAASTAAAPVSAVQAAASPPAPAAAPAAAAAEGPDLLQLSGQEFLSAVLGAWQVLGAPAAYRAAEAQQPCEQQQQLTDQLLPAVRCQLSRSNSQGEENSISTFNGIPMRLTTSSSSGALQQQQEVPLITCSSDLDWQGGASEARLIAGLGLTQAVERALAQLEKDTTAPDQAGSKAGTAATGVR